MPVYVYNIFKQRVMDGSINFVTDTFKCALVTSSYTPNVDTHLTYPNISSWEVSGQGYTAGGKILTGVTVLTDLASDYAYVRANDVSWPNSYITASGVIIYKAHPTDPTQSWLIMHIQFSTSKSSRNSTFWVQIEPAMFALS